MDLVGPYAWSTDCPLEKWFRDAKIYQLFEGTAEIQRMVISRMQAAEYRAALGGGRPGRGGGARLGHPVQQRGPGSRQGEAGSRVRERGRTGRRAEGRRLRLTTPGPGEPGPAGRGRGL